MARVRPVRHTLGTLGGACVCVCVCARVLGRSVVSDSLRPHGLCSSPGSSVHAIFQARIWSGLSLPSSGDLPDPGIEPTSLGHMAGHEKKGTSPPFGIQLVG